MKQTTIMNELNEFMNNLRIFLNTEGRAEANLIFDKFLVNLEKDETGYSIEIYREDTGKEEFESFDDSKIKEKIASYKECIEALDDNMFLDILDEMREVIDVKEMDSLLELERFTEENAARVEELIEHSTLIVQKYLQNKIQDCMELYEKFLNV